MSLRDYSVMERGVKAATMGVIAFWMLLAVWLTKSLWVGVLAAWVLVDLYRSARGAALRDERAERIELMSSHLCRQLTMLATLVLWLLSLTEPRALRPGVWPIAVLLLLFAPDRAIRWGLGLRDEERDDGAAAKLQRALGAVSAGLIVIMIGVLLTAARGLKTSLGLGWKDVFFEMPAPVVPRCTKEECSVILRPRKPLSEMSGAELKAAGVRVVPKDGKR